MDKTSVPPTFLCSVNQANEEVNCCEQIFLQGSILLKWHGFTALSPASSNCLASFLHLVLLYSTQGGSMFYCSAHRDDSCAIAQFTRRSHVLLHTSQGAFMFYCTAPGEDSCFIFLLPIRETIMAQKVIFRIGSHPCTWL